MAATTLSSPAGRYIRQSGGYDAFVPNRLPPAWELDPELAMLLSEATHALGRLDGIAGSVPDRGVFLFTYIRRGTALPPPRPHPASSATGT